ncbi:unnamed protein product [Bursaphelenchus xylophilus]|nr:unnamed protein product [Bursaphelenchus xylophilus]CAG9096514.1 unnamed protein product [Bursaphelenchus xylophilus]
MSFLDVVVFISLFITCNSLSLDKRIEEKFLNSTHTNNWAVLVDTSRYWFNYRHVTNVLIFYEAVKRLGIPDSNIIMMLADNIPCNARNPQPGEIHDDLNNNLYLNDIEVDYHGYEVTVEALVRLLTGQVDENTPRNKRLLSDQQSNVMVYLTGHGGVGFLKFQDAEEFTEVDVANVVETMYQQKRYNELFLIADTCHSESLYRSITSPNVLATSSSLLEEESVSYHMDSAIGVHTVDRYAFFCGRFLTKHVQDRNSTATMSGYLDSCPREDCLSGIGQRTDLFNRDPSRVRVVDFFGARKYTKPSTSEVNLLEEDGTPFTV